MKVTNCIRVEFTVFGKREICYTQEESLTTINLLIKKIIDTAHVISVTRVKVSNETFLGNNLQNIVEWIEKIKK